MTGSLQRTVPPGVDYTESWSEWDTTFKNVVLDAVRQQQWRLYPQHQPLLAQRQLADHLGIDPARIEFTRGADAAIDNAIRSAASRDHLVFTPEPAYPGYARASHRHRAHQRHYSATTNTAELAGISAHEPATVIFTWPGNPVGTPEFAAPRQSGPDQRWIVDATYVPLFDPSFMQLIDAGTADYDVVFSGSKTYGLAGLRLGGIIHSAPAAPDVRPPSFELDYLQLAAANALTDPGIRNQLHAREATTRALQAEILSNLQSAGHRVVYSTAASFSTVTVDAAQHFDSLHAKHFPSAQLTRVTTCPHNLRALAGTSL